MRKVKAPERFFGGHGTKGAVDAALFTIRIRIIYLVPRSPVLRHADRRKGLASARAFGDPALGELDADITRPGHRVIQPAT